MQCIRARRCRRSQRFPFPLIFIESLGHRPLRRGGPCFVAPHPHRARLCHHHPFRPDFSRTRRVVTAMATVLIAI
jgi:hypothetical protein